VLTGITGSQTGGQNAARISVTELPGGGGLGPTQWPNQLPPSGAQTAVDINIPFKFFGLLHCGAAT
jgi:hypothetical protein